MEAALSNQPDGRGVVHASVGDALTAAAGRVVGVQIKAGADPLSDDDDYFWRQVARNCGPEYVGKPLAEVHVKVRRLADIENARGRVQLRQGRWESHWTYDHARHMAALQLDSAISRRIAREIQKAKYGVAYV